MPAFCRPWARQRPPMPPPAIRTWNDMGATLCAAPLFGKLRSPILPIGVPDNRRAVVGGSGPEPADLAGRPVAGAQRQPGGRAARAEPAHAEHRTEPAAP